MITNSIVIMVVIIVLIVLLLLVSLSLELFSPYDDPSWYHRVV
jgi:hypothetical protein